jgi:hypothetical protein
MTMVEDMFRWRPVSRRYRCDRCIEPATVILDSLYLCSDCFLEESESRHGTPGNSHGDREGVQKHDTRSISQRAP